MCKTRGLSTAVLTSLSILLLWRKLSTSSLTHTLNMEECFFFFFFFYFTTSGRSHSLFVLEAVRKQAASCNTCKQYKHSQAFFNFLNHIPRKKELHIIPFSCVAGAFASQSDTFTLLSPSILVLPCDHVCRGSNTTLCD